MNERLSHSHQHGQRTGQSVFHLHVHVLGGREMTLASRVNV